LPQRTDDARFFHGSGESGRGFASMKTAFSHEIVGGRSLEFSAGC
jgi:hypothetical protein